MSTAAHEPRRVGPHRTDSTPGSKVTPRRNASEASEPAGLKYDSDEVPVLIRLPDLREAGAVESRPNAPTRQKYQAADRAAANKHPNPKHAKSKSEKKSIQQQAGEKKLILGGIVGGVLIVVMLFLFNSSSTPPAEQDGWASEAASLDTQDLEISLPNEISPPPPFPSFVYEAPKAAAGPVASSQSQPAQVRAPQLAEPPAMVESDTAAVPTKQNPVLGWPSEEAIGSKSAARSTPVNLWPGESLNLERTGYENSPTNSPGQADYRSSMYPSETESYRMGKLDAPDRPQATQGERDSILNGTIEIPDTTSIR